MAKSLLNNISKFTPGMKFGKELLNKAKFGAGYSEDDLITVEEGYVPDPLVSIFSTILLIVALYLAFKCGGRNNLNWVEIILAVLCSPFYIAYRMAIPC
jgi:hypothetical protein